MWTVLIVLACAERRPEPEAAPVEAASTRPVAAPATLPQGSRPAEATPALDAPEAPGAVPVVRDLLLARHTEDLPGRDTLEQHPGALEALAWLARYDGELMVRERALVSLALWASDPIAAETCAAVLGDAAAPAGARAAAAGCLGNQDLHGDAALRGAVEAAVADPEGRVGAAAAIALAGVPASKATLEAAAQDAALPEETREAAARALKYRR